MADVLFGMVLGNCKSNCRIEIHGRCVCMIPMPEQISDHCYVMTVQRVLSSGELPLSSGVLSMADGNVRHHTCPFERSLTGYVLIGRELLDVVPLGFGVRTMVPHGAIR